MWFNECDEEPSIAPFFGSIVDGKVIVGELIPGAYQFKSNNYIRYEYNFQRLYISECPEKDTEKEYDRNEKLLDNWAKTADVQKYLLEEINRERFNLSIMSDMIAKVKTENLPLLIVKNSELIKQIQKRLK